MYFLIYSDFIFPEFIWNGIFGVLETLISGLIIAYFTSTYLKKKEERTRIAGVIVEKRINSEQELLNFLEQKLVKEEININNSNIDDHLFIDLLEKYDFPIPHDGKCVQYASVFKSPKLFEEFFHSYEEMLLKHKLWLDTQVKEHLVFMQVCFGIFNTIPLMIKRIPLPRGKELTNKEFDKIHHHILFLLGYCCDDEINLFMSQLDEKIVDSVYKLELSRPKRSIMRNNLSNTDMNKMMNKLMKKSILGIYQEQIFDLIMDLVYEIKEIDVDKDFNDEFLKQFDLSREDFDNRFQDEFGEVFKNIEEKYGVTVARKGELDNFPDDFYGITFKELLDGKSPIKNKKRKRQLKKDRRRAK